MKNKASKGDTREHGGAGIQKALAAGLAGRKSGVDMKSEEGMKRLVEGSAKDNKDVQFLLK